MTHLILSEKNLLKTDTKGRVKTPAERRESLVDEFERSGLSGAKFAQLVGLKYQTFAAWVTRRRKARAKGSTSVGQKAPVQWLEAVVTPPAAATPATSLPVRLHLADGLSLEITHPQQAPLVAALVQALKQPLPPC